MSKKQSQGSDEAKTEQMLVRLEPGEKEAFQRAAAVNGIALSAWVRERLRRAAIQDLEAVRQPIAFLDHLSLG